MSPLHLPSKPLQPPVRLPRQVPQRQQLLRYNRYLRRQAMGRALPLEKEWQVHGFLPWLDASPTSMALI